MKLSENTLLRSLAAVTAIALLLSPGWLMMVAFTSLNFEVSFLAIFCSVLIAIFLSKYKWVGAVIASLLIAVPPYPYWAFASEKRGWYLHFFHGFPLHGEQYLRFAAVFAISLLLFRAIFWAIRKRPKQGSETEVSP